ncbi:hypothetical protein PLICRDRAFT_173330 [Plicaturopsis crispa FD-325 SS-3]|nr:hypothetical protein PLICRDRAFT_173330 [Plicaturopsis crispa FD-325 SS-3]
MSIAEFPLELIAEVFSFATLVHPIPSAILRINKAIHELCRPVLYTHLHFKSTAQLRSFSREYSLLCSPAKSITVRVAGGESDYDLFSCLRLAVVRCMSAAPSPAYPPVTTTPRARRNSQLHLDTLSLCLNSHARDPNLQAVEDSLKWTDPKVFTWTGPDPEHHFSTAIVPMAAVHLLNAMQTWSRIEHITMTNISFSLSCASSNPPSAGVTSLPSPSRLLGKIPTLRTLYIGSATFLSPEAVAAFVLVPGMDALERVSLVDVYSQSIWGPRVRRSDVEQAAIALGVVHCKAHEALALARVRRIVSCQKKAERIVGGDRALDGTADLD